MSRATRAGVKYAIVGSARARHGPTVAGLTNMGRRNVLCLGRRPGPIRPVEEDADAEERRRSAQPAEEDADAEERRRRSNTGRLAPGFNCAGYCSNRSEVLACRA